MKITTMFLCGVALAATPWLAMAQNYGDNQGSYVELQVGRSQLNDHSFNVPGGRITTDSENGDIALLNSGYNFGRWGLGTLRVEAELGYRNNGVGNQSFAPAGLGGEVSLNDPSGHTQVWSLMFNVMNDFRPGTAFDPYIGVGIGYARVDFHSYGVYPAGKDAAPLTLIDDVDSTFAYQGVIGFRSQLTRNLNLDVNWRYFEVNSPSFTNAAGQSVDSNYTSRAILVGLAYTF